MLAQANTDLLHNSCLLENKTHPTFSCSFAVEFSLDFIEADKKS